MPSITSVSRASLSQPSFSASKPSRRLGRLDHDRSATVAEQHRDAAVLPFHERADQLAAEHQRIAHHAGPDHRVCRAQGVQKARAGGVDVHGAGRRAPRRTCSPEAWFGTRSSKLQLPITISSTAAGSSPAAASARIDGNIGEIAERHVRNTPLPDAGAARDPLVAGVEEGREVGVGQDGRRQALAPTRDRRVRHRSGSRSFVEAATLPARGGPARDRHSGPGSGRPPDGNATMRLPCTMPQVEGQNDEQGKSCSEGGTGRRRSDRCGYDVRAPRRRGRSGSRSPRS